MKLTIDLEKKMRLSAGKHEAVIHVLVEAIALLHLARGTRAYRQNPVTKAFTVWTNTAVYGNPHWVVFSCFSSGEPGAG
ncbi:MAG: hypothetical protein QXN55_00520 [Candidatus Nitrosotenuis sp.]